MTKSTQKREVETCGEFNEKFKNSDLIGINMNKEIQFISFDL